MLVSTCVAYALALGPRLTFDNSSKLVPFAIVTTGLMISTSSSPSLTST